MKLLDPNVFDVLQLPAAFGDLKSALAQPDGIVLTRKMARKYFGRDNPVGAVIELARKHPMRVTARHQFREPDDSACDAPRH